MRLGSFKIKFILCTTLLILLASLSFLAFFLYRSNYFIKDGLINFGFHLARDLSYGSELAIASEDPIFLQPSCEGTFEEEEVVLVAVYNKRGNTIVSKKKVEIEEKIPQDVVQELLREGKAVKKINFTKEGQKIYSFYSPVFAAETLISTPTTKPKEKKLIGFVRVGLSLERIKIESRSILFLGLSITALIILLGIFISFFLAVKIVKPIALLAKGVDTITRGDLDYRIKIKTGDEIEDLAKSFNQMTKSLKVSRDALEESKSVLEIKGKARTKELKELTKGLEDKVKQRTEELQDRVDELEKFHKLTVGREKKMLELKKEINKIKKEIAKTNELRKRKTIRKRSKRAIKKERKYQRRKLSNSWTHKKEIRLRESKRIRKRVK